VRDTAEAVSYIVDGVPDTAERATYRERGFCGTPGEAIDSAEGATCTGDGATYACSGGSSELKARVTDPKERLTAPPRTVAARRRRLQTRRRRVPTRRPECRLNAAIGGSLASVAGSTERGTS